MTKGKVRNEIGYVCELRGRLCLFAGCIENGVALGLIGKEHCQGHDVNWGAVCSN